MKRFLLSMLTSVLAALPVLSRDGGLPQDFRQTVDFNPELRFSNPSALGFQNPGKLTYAEIDGGKQDGGLISTGESTDSFGAGIKTESYLRISEKLAFYGKLGWNYFEGKKMGGPVLLDQYYNPINFYESTSGTTGVKKKEMFDLCGALAWTVAEHWAIGARFDYTCGDYTKVKDPRYNDIWMDLKAGAGVYFKPDGKFRAGLSVFRRKTLEQLKAGVLGTVDKQYYMSVDKGCFFGINQIVDGDNSLIPTGNYNHMNNIFLGGELQLSYGNFFSELSFSRRDGYFGLRSTSTPVYFEFGGIEAGLDASLIVPRQRRKTLFSLNARYKPLKNFENSFDYVTPTGKSTYVDYKSKTERSNSTDIAAALGWKLLTGTDRIRPTWEFGADASFEMKEMTTTIFPFYRKRSNQYADASFRATRNFIAAAGKDIFSAGIGAGFRIGMGVPVTDGTLASAATTSLKKFDNYLNPQHEFEAGPCVKGALTLGYTRIFSDSFAAYVRLEDSFASLTKAPQYLQGKTRNCAVITIGCNF